MQQCIERSLVALSVEAAGRNDGVREQLTKLLEHGLTWRVGRKLSYDEACVFDALVGRGLELSDGAPRRCHGLGCGVIYVGRGRSAYCPRCRDSPAVVPSPRAHHREDGPAVVRIGGWDDLESRRTTYEALCRSCRHGFTAHDPRTSCCLSCRDNAGRQRRFRGRGVPRKRYRYAAIGDLEGKAFTISLNRGYGELVMLEADDGILETTDAEVAKHLDFRPDLRRL